MNDEPTASTSLHRTVPACLLTPMSTIVSGGCLLLLVFACSKLSEVDNVVQAGIHPLCRKRGRWPSRGVENLFGREAGPTALALLMTPHVLAAPCFHFEESTHKQTRSSRGTPTASVARQSETCVLLLFTTHDSAGGGH